MTQAQRALVQNLIDRATDRFSRPPFVVAVEADALTALLAAPETPSGWQDISTAPKDGRAVLLYPSGCWTEEEDCGEVAYWMEDMGGWVTQGRRADDAAAPTHWAALPTPPRPGATTP